MEDASSPPCVEPLETWLAAHFDDVLSAPMAERHRRMWNWLESLAPGVKPPALIELWPRGSGKSTTLELGVVRLGITLARRFGLYVCATQEQADYHVRSIADWFERVGIERAISVYGTSKGWRRNQLRTANGFTVASLGLDVAMRGIKIGAYRPDLIVFDDVDDVTDSSAVVARKLDSVQSRVLAAGSADCAVVFIQNLVHEDSIASQLLDGRAPFLLDRMPITVERAIENLEVDTIERGDGSRIWRIVSGTATWEGQSLAVCERQINEWSLGTFLREAQQEVELAGGYVFDVSRLTIEELPQHRIGWRYAIGCDFAATENGGDYTAFVLMGRAPSGVVYVMDVQRGQWNEARVRHGLIAFCLAAIERCGPVTIRIPRDPGQAGIAHANQIKAALVEAGVAPTEVVTASVTGAKALRARPLAAAVGSGNVRLARGVWNAAFVGELKRFTETGDHDHDDQVDAASDAFMQLTKPVRELKTFIGGANRS